MSKQRQFEETHQRHGGAFQRVARIACSRCGVSSSVNIQTATGFLPANVIRERFEHLKWEVGKSHDRDLCPGCVLKQKQEKSNLKIVANSPQHVASSPSQQPPRVMQRDDRRIIFEKLNEVYLDDKRGYEAGWSDHRIATDLGVPRSWVETVRKEMFGDIGASSEMVEYLSQMDAFAKQARQDLIEARNLYQKVEDLFEHSPIRTINELGDRLSKLERLAAEVRKLVTVS
jgi:hypothetical protein